MLLGKSYYRSQRPAISEGTFVSLIFPLRIGESRVEEEIFVIDNGWRSP
ncbi:MAG: hypothetical protein PUP93_04835 [Rhizonema sp. NSF051]|nr:hypothetical protein [Rhizonema sp. NSF051]